ncbi:MAG: hypothetical protein JO036_05105 [Candidatus Eremiobacteraeota bacterium]|nr:hypothetical protein [Candidatus Eremiobacteraeota bacterium]
MSLSAIVDVAIVLIALYVSLSCAVSWVHEQIATALNLRGKMLYAGVLNLVFGHPEIVERIFSHPLVTSGVRTATGVKAPPSASQAGGDAVVSSVQDAVQRVTAYRPSYIDARNFSVAFWQSVNAPNLPVTDVAPLLAETPAKLLEDLKDPVNALVGPYPNLHQTCIALIAQAEGDYQKLLATTDGWFEAQMDRVSGWYKRQTQFVVIALALLLVSFSGLDSIEIAKRLYLDPELRAAVVLPIVQTVQSVQPNAPAPGASPSPADAAARGTAVTQTVDQVLQTTSLAQLVHVSLNPFANWPHHAFGMFLTLVALSLGGPFWFDLLSLFVNVRLEGRKPQRTDQPPR